MIGSLSGKIIHKELNSFIVDVRGIGYKIFVPLEVALAGEENSEIFLWTYLAVRESSLDLFGFSDRESLEVFELLITISGIGPKSALNILNVASPEILRQAVANEDTSYLTRVSGIGKKSAEKIILGLKDKIKFTSDDKNLDTRSEGDALEALVSLGYTDRDARDALKKVSKDIEGASERVKQALKLLANGN
jgi:Holliday junction DNA helicase RuvA